MSKVQQDWHVHGVEGAFLPFRGGSPPFFCALCDTCRCWLVIVDLDGEQHIRLATRTESALMDEINHREVERLKSVRGEDHD